MDRRNPGSRLAGHPESPSWRTACAWATRRGTSAIGSRLARQRGCSSRMRACGSAELRDEIDHRSICARPWAGTPPPRIKGGPPYLFASPNVARAAHRRWPLVLQPLPSGRLRSRRAPERSRGRVGAGESRVSGTRRGVQGMVGCDRRVAAVRRFQRRAHGLSRQRRSYCSSNGRGHGSRTAALRRTLAGLSGRPIRRALCLPAASKARSARRVRREPNSMARRRGRRTSVESAPSPAARALWDAGAAGTAGSRCTY